MKRIFTCLVAALAFGLVAGGQKAAAQTNTAPFVPTKSTYYGLFYNPGEVEWDNAGYFTLTTTTKRNYSGSLQIVNAHYSFSGTFDTNGFATELIKRGSKNTLTIHMQVDNALGGEQLKGTVSDSVWVSDLLANRSRFNSHTNPATAFRGNYTMVLPGSDDPALPFGDSCASVRVQKDGKVRFNISLADNKEAHVTTMLATNGQWALFLPLYSNKGLLVSWITFTNRPGTTNTLPDAIHGSLAWVKKADNSTRYFPNGFTNNSIPAVGPKWVTPPPKTRLLDFTNGVAIFYGGELTTPFTNRFTLLDDNTIINHGPGDMSMRFTVDAGIFSGSVVTPENRTVTYRGMLWPGLDFGLGYYFDHHQSTRVWLGGE